jgi:hypothetical protein
VRRSRRASQHHASTALPFAQARLPATQVERTGAHQLDGRAAARDERGERQRRVDGRVLLLDRSRRDNRQLQALVG